MKIWHTEFSLDQIHTRIQNTIVSHLGIEFTGFTDHSLSARMPVDHRTRQPRGIMHGGSSCVLAESIASIGANLCVDPTKYYCVGLDINTNHIRAISEGFVFGTATPFHLGKSTQVWNIEINNEAGKLVSISRLTLAVLKQKL